MNILKSHISIFWIALFLLGITVLLVTADSAEAANGIYVKRLNKVWDRHEIESPRSLHSTSLYRAGTPLMKPCNWPANIQAHRAPIASDLFYRNDNVPGFRPTGTRSDCFAESYQEKKKRRGSHP